MKFKLKQPTKYMHQNLQQQHSSSHDINVQSEEQNLYKNPRKQKIIEKNIVYKNKKIIKKKNQPSALRLEKINQTFQNIYNHSNELFNDLNIDHQELQKFSNIKQKNKCKCNKNVKFYCLKCMQKVCIQDLPSVKLPLQICVIHHQSQKINKSSALPLEFLTDNINFNFYSSSESNEKLWTSLLKPSKNTYILFPHKNSKTLNQIEQPQKIQNLIILDCTWFQTDLLVSEMGKNGYNNYIRIQGYKSIYWRYNHHNDEALCSAEAITFFMRQYQKVIIAKKMIKDNSLQSDKQIKKYDNLLFLYCLNLKMIKRQQQNRMQKSQKQQDCNNKIHHESKQQNC